MSIDASTAIPVGVTTPAPPVAASPSIITSASIPPKPAPSGGELSSILMQVQALQADRERLQKELETSQVKMDKLQEGKRSDMQKILDTVITKWLADSVESEEARKTFVEGMDRLVKGTKEDNGIWQVACQASHAHARRLEELERLRVECSSLKEAAPAGRFGDESSRKRGREEPPAAQDDDIWSTFQYHDPA